jgi:hypothetical protein
LCTAGTVSLQAEQSSTATGVRRSKLLGLLTAVSEVTTWSLAYEVGAQPRQFGFSEHMDPWRPFQTVPAAESISGSGPDAVAGATVETGATSSSSTGVTVLDTFVQGLAARIGGFGRASLSHPQVRVSSDASSL